jgi:hypothetical protein
MDPHKDLEGINQSSGSEYSDSSDHDETPASDDVSTSRVESITEFVSASVP